MAEPGVIYSATYWPTNADMITDCARLGYLRSSWLTLDPTWGFGNFWTTFRPRDLVRGDIDPHGPGTWDMDFRALPFRDEAFSAVVFDPPYKLNGTPSFPDTRYGVQYPTRWQDRIGLIRRGVKECARVTSHMLLVKCQDQVVSGKVVWQTDIVTAAAEQAGCKKVDRLDFLTNPRPQPHTRQLHARRNYSTMLVFEKRG